MSKLKMPLEKYWKERFESYATKHDEDYLISGWSNKGLQRRVQTFLRIFEKENLKKGTTLLDLGCGGGTYTRLLSKMGYKVVGLDYSEPTIKKAISKDSLKKVYIIGEAYHLPFKKDTFDAIICIGVFQSLENKHTAIKEIDYVLKENGILFLDALNSIGLSVFFKNIWRKFTGKPKRLNTYNPCKLKETFRELGYNNVKISGVYILPKILSKLEEIFFRFGVFQMIDRTFFLLLFSHAFILKAEKPDNLNPFNGDYNGLGKQEKINKKFYP